MAHIINHPCEGMDCRQCETCKFDEPIPEIKMPTRDESHTTQDSLCNYCGYLIKAFRDHGDKKYNACCGKHLIQSEGTTRPRTISFRIEDPIDIPVPDWCPQLLNSSPSSPSQLSKILESVECLPTPAEQKTAYNSYYEKRKKMQGFPKHVDWENIKEGKLYVIPQIMKQKGKIVRAIAKTEYTLRCTVVDENLEDTCYVHNIYRQDLDAVFFVEYHKF